MRQADNRSKILFICNDSFRSKMARAWTLKLRENSFKPYALGVFHQGELDMYATQAMREEGLEFNHGKSINKSTLDKYHFDYVVVLCALIKDQLPAFSPETKVIHVYFPDPVDTSRMLTREEVLEINRRVRDEIRDFIKALPENLTFLSQIDPP